MVGMIGGCIDANNRRRGEEGRGLPQNMLGLPSMRFAALETAKKEENRRKEKNRRQKN